MNIFKKLASQLIKCPMWRSEIIVTQLRQVKENGRLYKEEETSKKLFAVVETIKRQTDDATYTTFIQFTLPVNSLDDFDLENGLMQIVYNNKVYDVEEVHPGGIMNNEAAVYSLVIRG